MTDLLGPGDAGAPRALSTTTDVSIPETGDTWFGDCVANTPGTGTPIISRWLNRLTQQMRRVIRNADVAPLDNADDDMLSLAVQSQAMNWAGTFGGSANALTASLAPQPLALGGGLLIAGIVGASPNTGAVTLTVNGDPLSLVKQNGSPLVKNDLPAGALLVARCDGAEWRLQYPVASDYVALGVPRNSAVFSTTTRVVMVGNGGNSYTVTPWSPGNYTKQSATSKLFVWAMFPTFTPVSPGQGAPQVALTIGGVTEAAISGNNQSSQAVGMNTSVFEFDSVGAGAQAVSVTFKRSDTTAWQMSLCANSTDLASLAAASQATIIIMEVGA